MPNAWSAKDQRQHQHIKDSAKDRGASEAGAQEIAARTVNKLRRSEGLTASRRTQGTGNPNLGLERRTRDELYNIARERRIRGRSAMTKQELVAALRR